MPDEIDRSEERELQQREARIRQIAERAGRLEHEPTGHCLFCREPQEDPRRRFCDADCRDEFELTQEARPWG